MQYDEILYHLAPCGLNCCKCFAHTNGQISFHSRKLKGLLGQFDIYAKRFSAFIPAFNDYPFFKRMLCYFSEPDCMGCRQGTCKYPNCGVVECYKEKGVDFCFQCDEFPCEKTNFDLHLKERWIKMNKRMQKNGVVAYYEETKDVSRYL